LSPPYDHTKVDRSAYGAKRPVRGSVIALLDVVFQDRGLQLIETKSRALKKDEIHELMVTDEETGPGGGADRVRPLAFFEVEDSGLVVVGDTVYLDGRPLGVLAGFDETHMPNHMNIVVKAPSLDPVEMAVGSKLEFKPG